MSSELDPILSAEGGNVQATTKEEPNIPWGLVFHTIRNKGAYPALVIVLVAMNLDWAWVGNVC